MISRIWSVTMTWQDGMTSWQLKIVSWSYDRVEVGTGNDWTWWGDGIAKVGPPKHSAFS